MKIRTLDDLFHSTLQELHAGETLMIGAFEGMARSPRSAGVAGAIGAQAAHTAERRERLERMLRRIDRAPAAVRCPAIEAMLVDMHELMLGIEDAGTREAALIGAAQAATGYALARHLALDAWARALGFADAAKTPDGAAPAAKPPEAPAAGPARASRGSPGEPSLGDRLTALFERKR